MTLADYKKQIDKAITKDELREISYKAFLQDDNALRGCRSLYDEIVTLLVKREEALGL